MEHKDRGFVGKHYLIKQAFGQEELHQREECVPERIPPGVPRRVPFIWMCGLSALMGQKEILEKPQGSFAELLLFSIFWQKPAPGCAKRPAPCHG